MQCASSTTTATIWLNRGGSPNILRHLSPINKASGAQYSSLYTPAFTSFSFACSLASTPWLPLSIAALTFLLLETWSTIRDTNGETQPLHYAAVGGTRFYLTCSQTKTIVPEDIAKASWQPQEHIFTLRNKLYSFSLLLQDDVTMLK